MFDHTGVVEGLDELDESCGPRAYGAVGGRPIGNGVALYSGVVRRHGGDVGAAA